MGKGFSCVPRDETQAVRKRGGQKHNANQRRYHGEKRNRGNLHRATVAADSSVNAREHADFERYSRAPPELQEHSRVQHNQKRFTLSHTGISSGLDLTTIPDLQLNTPEHRRFRADVGQSPAANRGVKAVACFDYAARDKDELTFKRGDVMLILEEELPEYDTWVNAKLLKPPSKIGKVPSNFLAEFNRLTEYEHQWFYGNLERREAERLLLSNQNTEYSFLVRLSAAKKNAYSISVRIDDRVSHFAIYKNELDRLYLQSNVTFKNLPKLVEYYRKNDPSRGFYLKEACKRVGTPQTKGLSSSLVDNWELDRSLITLGKQLGQGNFGEVFLGKWCNQTEIAVKRLKNDAKTNAADEFLREAGALKKLHHSNIVELYGVCTKQEPFYLVTEFMVNGDLKNYLRKGDGQNLSLKKLIDIGVQVASGMAYLEEKHFVHRDLAARNILVGNDDVYKVADFGMSELMECGYYAPKSQNFSRAIRWAAPEVLECSQFSINSDVWAFGICLFEIIEKGANPYPDYVQKEQVQHLVLSGGMMQYSCMPHCPKEFYEIMQKCWQFTASHRPTFAQLYDILVEYLETKFPEYVPMAPIQNAK